jgi:hypothetical protein
MNMHELGEATLTRSAYRPYWGRTTTTIDEEPPDVSISSHAPPARIFGHILIALTAHNYQKAVSRDFGKLFVLQSQRQHDFGTSATSATLLSLLMERAHPPGPTFDYHDEVLNWDAAIEGAPARPSGSIPVTLRYAGRGGPTPVKDPWD